MKSLNFATAVIACASISASGYAEERPRPNILWLTFEDTSAEYIGCYGNQMTKTPTIDRLAREGVRFTNTFSTGTVSSASRFCLITGCKPGKYGTGNHRSGYVIPDFVNGFPEYLKGDGYYTTNNYKTDYNHSGHKQMANDSWNECSNKATWRNRKPGQPFFAVQNSNYSHQSKTMTNPWEVYEKQVLSGLKPENTLAVDADFAMPPYFRDSPEMRKDFSRVYNSIARTDQDMGETLKKLEDDGLLDSTIIFCFSDHGEGMPRAKGTALMSGHRVPFVLYIPEMYKDLVPWERGSVSDELISFEDMSATVLALAGIELPDYHEGVPFMPKSELEDREEKKPYVFGQCDRVDDCTDLTRTVTDGDYMYARVFTSYQPFVRWINYFDHADVQKHMRHDFSEGLLNDCQAEILSPRCIEYLYDIKNDVWEVNNLASSLKYRSKLKQMRKALFEHLEETRDANFIPEYTLAKYYKKVTPYELRLDDELFPFEEVLETASLCGKGSKVIKEQIKKLESENDIVNYWAAIGLFTQRENNEKRVDKLIEILPTLNYPPAQVWTAAAILEIKENEVAREVINSGLMSNNVQLAVCTFNALLVLKMYAAKSFIPKLQELERSKPRKAEVKESLALAKLRIMGIPYRHENFW